MVTLKPGTVESIKLFPAEKNGLKPVRIDLRFAGCCDPSLGLSLDNIRESDIVQEIEALTFVISPETLELTGDVTISYAEESDKKGFKITSARPVSEWDGFGLCSIKT